MRKNVEYRKPPAIKRVKLAKFRGVSDEYYSTDLPIEVAVEQLNLQEINGLLTEGEGLMLYEIPKANLKLIDAFSVVCIHYNKGSESSNRPTILLCSGMGIFWYRYHETGAPSYFEDDKFVTAHSGATYEADDKRYTLLPGTQDNIYSFDGLYWVDHKVGHTFNNIVNHYGRLFAGKEERSTLYFSALFDPYNWNESIDEGGYINLPAENGAITQLLSFGEILLAVQERGLSKVTAFAEQVDFSVKYINIENDIIAGSAVNCMDRVVYCSSTGIGVFDGYESKIYCRELSSRLAGRQISGAYLEGRCYFSLTDKSGDEITTEILVLNLSQMKYHFISNEHGDALLSVRTGNTKHIINYYHDNDLKKQRTNDIHYLTDAVSGADKVWRSGRIDFGRSDVDKLVRNIVFGGNSPLHFEVECDGDKSRFDVDIDRRVMLNLRGKSFAFEMRPTGYKVSLPSPVIEYQILEDL